MKPNYLLYKESVWSLKEYLLKTWNLWAILLTFFSICIFILYKFAENGYFDTEIVSTQYSVVDIAAIKSETSPSIILYTLLDPARPYVVELGYSCKINPLTIGTQINMKVNTYKRNYNKTYFFDFPEVKNKICK